MKYIVTLNNKRQVFITEKEYLHLMESLDKRFVQLKDVTINPAYVMFIELNEDFIKTENYQLKQAINYDKLDEVTKNDLKNARENPKQLNELLKTLSLKIK